MRHEQSHQPRFQRKILQPDNGGEATSLPPQNNRNNIHSITAPAYAKTDRQHPAHIPQQRNHSRSKRHKTHEQVLQETAKQERDLFAKLDVLMNKMDDFELRA